jgi:hypothetical protein
MSRCKLGTVVLLILCGAALSGCQSQHLAYQDDPLLILHEPMEGKPEAATSAQLARAEPAPPPLPAYAYVNPPHPPRSLDEPKGSPDALASKPPAPEPPAHPPLPPLAAAPPPPARTLPRLPWLPVGRRKVTGTYGHAADYAWLQGVVERAPAGGLELRFCDPGTANGYDGRVPLVWSAGASSVHEGDIIQVEGRLLSEPGGRRAYEVHRFWRVR